MNFTIILEFYGVHNFLNHSLKKNIVKKLTKLMLPLFRSLSPEFAHDLALFVISHKFFRRVSRDLNAKMLSEINQNQIDLRCHIDGIAPLAHPIGLAAGYDKHATAVDGLFDLGFSFVELGTVTLNPQPGNPKPRMFRLRDQFGLINRMGFNSVGIGKFKVNLRQNYRSRLPLGINIGKNKEIHGEQVLSDYLKLAYEGLRQARYVTINLSSPNTPGLRNYATPEFIDSLAINLTKELHRIWVKLDPDMPKNRFQEIIERLTVHKFAGAILTNTATIAHPQQGGYSGHALSVAAAARLEWAYEIHQGALAMIATGGILTGRDVWERLIRGASAVQLWTAIVYRGPFVVQEILEELSEIMRLNSVNSVQDCIGLYYKE
jgi:dihydroorotate dehydrogenase